MAFASYTHTAVAPDFKDPPNLFGMGPAHSWSANSGPLNTRDDSKQAYAVAKAQKDSALAAYFGQNTKPDTPNPYDAYDIENHQLPDGFAGSRPYVKYILLKMITMAEQFPFREMCPIKPNDHSMEISWDCWCFNNHMLTRVPEESVSRLLTSNQTSSSESMVRWGIALMLEHGFYQTPRGKLAYSMNLKQIANAVATTLAYGAMYACLNAHYTDRNNKYRKIQARGLIQIKQLFQEEIDSWSIIQKQEGGWKIIFEKCKRTLIERIQKPGNYTVVPQGMRKYLEGRPENNYFLYNGIPGGQRANVMPYEGTLRESVGYRTGEHESSDDVMIRERTIGGFFHMLPEHIDDIPADEYRTGMMDTDIYSEDIDDYFTVKYRAALEKTGLFETEDGSWNLTPEIGKPFFAAYGNNTWGDFLQKTGRLDAFVKSIQCASDETKRAFAKVVGIDTQKVDSTAPNEEEAPLEHEEEDAQGHGQKKQTTDNNGKDDSSSSSSSSEAAESISKLGGLAEIVPCENSSSVKAYFHTLSHFFDKTVLDELHEGHSELILDAFVTAMGYDNLRDDTRRSLLCMKHAYPDGSLTPFERFLEEKDNADVTSPECRMFDESCPRWVDSQPDKVQEIQRISIPVNYTSPSRNLLITRTSMAFTLSSTNIVLFALSPKQIASLAASRGKIEVSCVDAFQPDVMGERIALMQFSVAISAIYFKIKEFVDAFSNLTGQSKEPSDSVFQTLYKDIFKLCPVSLSINDVDGVFAEYINSMRKTKKRKRFVPLLCQYRLHNIIAELRDFLFMVLAMNHIAIEDSSSSKTQAFARRVTLLCKHMKGDIQMKAYHINHRTSSPEMGAFPDILETASVSRSHWNAWLDRCARMHPKEQKDIIESQTIALVKVAYADVTAGKSDSDVAIIDRLLEEHVDSILAVGYTLMIVNGNRIPDRRLINFVAFIVALKLGVHNTNLTSEDMLVTFTRLLIETYTRVEKENGATKFQKEIDKVVSHEVQKENGIRQTRLKTHNGVKRGHTFHDVITEKSFGEQPPSIFTVEMNGLELQYFKKMIEKTLTNNWTQGMKNAHSEDETEHSDRVALIESILDSHDVAKSAKDWAETPNQADHYFEAAKDEHKNAIKNAATATILGYRPLRSLHVITPQPTVKIIGEASEDITTQHFFSVTRIRDILFNWRIKNGLLVLFCLDNNICPIIGILGFRPFKRYDMGTMLHMMGQGEAASTWYGHADFQLSDNVAQKMHYGHFTMYAKTVVMHPEMIVRGDNIVVMSYNGGNGTRAWDPRDQNLRDEFDSNNLIADIFYAPVPANFEVASHFLDITGRFSSRLSANAEAQKATDYGPAANILSQIWGWKAIASPFTREHFSSIAPRFNTMVFQEHQWLYSHSSKRHDRVIVDKGHFGGNVYPGVADVRRGVSMYVKTVDYTKTRATIISAS